jgi:hypothetical protein
MLDKEKILIALAKLDPLDDDHWTIDGSPKIEVVSNLVSSTVKRQDIVNAAPDFNREKASIGEISQTTEKKEQENGKKETKVSKEELSIPEFQSKLVNLPREELEYVELSLKTQHDSVGLEIKNLQEQQKRIAIAISMTRNRIKATFPNSPDAHAIRSFIESQSLARAARVERRQTILKGIRPEELDYRAPIDAAMARKTKRGFQRPVRLLVK